MSMNLLDIEKIELELSSDCNAACPGCARTQLDGTYDVKNITFADVQRLFPDKEYIEGKQFKICGVLGDPIVNPECLDILTYLAENGGYCDVSTNGSYNTAEWGAKLGQVNPATKKIKNHELNDRSKYLNLFSIGLAIISGNSDIGIGSNITLNSNLINEISKHTVNFEIEADNFMIDQIKKNEINTSELISFLKKILFKNKIINNFFQRHCINIISRVIIIFK